MSVDEVCGSMNVREMCRDKLYVSVHVCLSGTTLNPGIYCTQRGSGVRSFAGVY